MRASFIDVVSISTCKNDINFHLSTIDGGVGKLASTRYAHTLAVGSAQTFRTLSSEVNIADFFTKVLEKFLFQKHRRVIMNLVARSTGRAGQLVAAYAGRG